MTRRVRRHQNFSGVFFVLSLQKTLLNPLIRRLADNELGRVRGARGSRAPRHRRLDGSGLYLGEEAIKLQVELLASDEALSS